MENKKCFVAGCTNKHGCGTGYRFTLLGEERFICNPCLQYIMYMTGGKHSQILRNAKSEIRNCPHIETCDTEINNPKCKRCPKILEDRLLGCEKELGIQITIVAEWVNKASKIAQERDGFKKLIKEVCICAAWEAQNGKVYRGHRHVHCLDAMEDAGTVPAKGAVSQGFITSTGRFVNRYEGYKLQTNAGIASVAKDGYRGDRLFSEDLY